MIWQTMMAMLHSNGQLMTEGDGDTEKGCQKPAVQQKTTELRRIRSRSLLKVTVSRQIRFVGHIMGKNQLEAIALTHDEEPLSLPIPQ